MALVEQGEAAADALERLDALALELDQHARGVLVGAAADLVRLALALGDDLAPSVSSAARVSSRSSMRNAACSWARARMRSASSWARSTRRSVSSLMRLACADLLGHGDAQLVDEVERARLVHDHGVGHGHAAAVGDQRLEVLDEEDDVDGSGLRVRTGQAVDGAVLSADRTALSGSAGAARTRGGHHLG